MTSSNDRKREPYAAAAAALGLPTCAQAAAGGTLFEGLVLPLVVIGIAFWIAYAAIPPFRRAVLRLPKDANRPLLLVLGAAALAFAGVSVLLGKTTIGVGVIAQDIEPRWFWQLIKLQVGAGLVLLVLGILAKGRPK
jgi:hypothetical protein